MRERTDCRMCHGELKLGISLGQTPIANNFQEKPNSGDFYPLDLMECVNCGHVQLKHVLTGLFDDYRYETPDAYKPHLKATAELLRRRYPYIENVVEIGSNNGTYTEILGECFNSVIGVDPAGTHWASWTSSFDKKTAIRIYKRMGPIDLVVANNVFAHINNLDEVFEGIDFILDPKGVVIIEVQDFQASLDKGIFDMIYHEHLDQHRPGPWKHLLNKHNLKLSAVEHISPHGGSIRITATRNFETDWVDPPIEWEEYGAKIVKTINKLQALPDNITAWGATAKLTTLIHTCNLQDKIRYCVDSTKGKQGRYLPGTGIKIVPEFEPDAEVVLLGAWNYEEVFKEKYNLTGVNPYD